MAGVVLSCPRCRFTFTLASARGPVPCPMCKTPIEAAGQGGEAKPSAWARPAPARDGAGPLTGLGELLSEAWAVYRARWLVLLGLYLVAVVLALVPFGVGAGIAAAASGSLPALAVAGLAAVVGSAWAGGWGASAFCHALDDDGLSVREALGAGRPAAWSFAWALLLLGFVLAGGTLLLLLPGIVFGVWFAFAPFAVVEGSRGMDALARSRALVRGHGLDVFVRLLVVSVLGALVGAIPLVGPVLSLLFTPFAAICSHLVFDELRRRAPEAGPSSSPGGKAGVLAVAAAGYLVLPTLLIALAGASVPALLAAARLGPGALLSAGPGGLEVQAVSAPGRAPGAAGAQAPGRGAPGFEEVRGAWEGALAEGGAGWRFEFTEPDEVEISGPGGAHLRGRAAVQWGLGLEDGSLRVLPGGYPFDVRITESSDDGAVRRIALGSFKREGAALKLCLGAPGATRRTSEFRTADGTSCFALERVAGAPAEDAGEDEDAPVEAGEEPVEAERAAGGGGAGAEPPERLEDLALFVYAVNYTGVLRVNGEVVQELEGEHDVQYNYNRGGDGFRRGKNVLELEYARRPDASALRKVEIRVSAWGDGPRRELARWVVEDERGSRTFELEL